MSKHCNSKFRHPDIHSVEIAKLQPMSYHVDERWKFRDLPDISKNGLNYPLLYYKVTTDWWHTKFANWASGTPGWKIINPPIVNDNNEIWAIKIGSNRYQVVKHLNYSSVDCICFTDVNKIIEFRNWIRDTDPVSAENAINE